MSDFILHCFAESGNAYKVALLMEVSGLDWTLVDVDFFSGQADDPLCDPAVTCLSWHLGVEPAQRTPLVSAAIQQIQKLTTSIR